MVVLKMFGHLGELAPLAEAEDGGCLVDIDDALPVDAERHAAVFVDLPVTCQHGLWKTRSL